MSDRSIFSGVWTRMTVLVFGLSCLSPSLAEEEASEPEMPPGILPVPSYDGSFSSRDYLTGNWNGERSEWAEKNGFQFDVDLLQWSESVVDGGVSDKWKTGGNATYNLKWDLHRAGVVPGAVIQARAESRWGRSTMLTTGLVVPANTAALTPTNYVDFDEGYDLALTQLTWLQIFNEHFGIIAGKLDLFGEGDMNEFATGRGRTQFNNWSINYPTGALLVPASTIGAGVVIMPNHNLTITSLVVSGTECVDSDCFDDLDDKGYISATTASFQYRLGGKPGGFTAGYIHFFDKDFTDLSSILPVPNEGLVGSEEDQSWSTSGSFFQYLSAEDAPEGPLNLTDHLPDLRGWGLFARFSFADDKTNPWETSISAGVGGRGLFPKRPDDLFGVGYFYNDLSTDRFLPELGYQEDLQGVEAFYNVFLTRAIRLSANVQYLESIAPDIDDSVVVGGRLQVIF